MMRVFVASLLLIVAGCAALEPPRAEDQNAAFDAAVALSTREYLAANPLYASYLGVSEEVAGGRYKDRLPETGVAALEAQEALRDAILARIAAFDPDALTPGRREQRAVVVDVLSAAQAADEAARAGGFVTAGDYQSPYIATQIGGPYIDLPQTLSIAHPIETRDDVDAYLARLDQIGVYVDGMTEVAEANAAAGVIPPDFMIDGALDALNGFIADAPGDNPLVVHLKDGLDAIELEDEDEEAAIAAATESVATIAYPAYRRLAAALERERADASHVVGVTRLPNGSAYYDALIRANGESALSADEIHALGLSEVARIEAEMDAILRSLGRTEGSVGERMAAMTADPAYAFPEGDEGRAEILGYAGELLAAAAAASETYFDVTPSIGVEAQRMATYAEPGSPKAYYYAPSEGGERGGIVMLNLRDTAIHPRWTLPTLVFHEGIPGHHFHLALAKEAEETPVLVRELASSNAFTEGWALYAEALAKEMGLYADDPEGDLGRLQGEMWRAVRLVVDSGMHAEGWSREQAIDYMREKTGIEESDIVAEIERYAAWPGQALAYKNGMMTIQALRARAAAALGADFDVGAFHHQVLRDGGAPLSVLEARIDAWIAAGGPGPD